MAPADAFSLSLFGMTGLMIAWLNRQLRAAEASHRSAAALGTARAERLDAVFNTAVDGIIVINDKGLIEVLNRGAERLFGYPAAEVVGRNISMLMPSPYHEEHDSYLERYLSTGAAKIIGIGREVTGRRRDGSTFPLHLSVGEMTIGGERKFTGMLHDLTARVQLEEQLRASEARWRAIIDSAVDGIVVIDNYGRIEAFNPAAERLFGYTEAEVLTRNVNVLMPSPYHDEHDRYLSRYLATGAPRIIGIGREVTGRRKDGTTFPLHLSVGQFTIGGERKFTGMLHDLSARVRIGEQAARADLARQTGRDGCRHRPRSEESSGRDSWGDSNDRDTIAPQSSDSAMVKEIVTRIDSLNEMMKDLLLFARPPQPRPLPTEIVPLIRITANLLPRIPRCGPAHRGRRFLSRDPRGCRNAQNRVSESARQRRSRDEGPGTDPRRSHDGRLVLPDRLHRPRAGHLCRGPREDFHAVLHHQVARLRAGPPHRQAVDRSPERSDLDRVPAHRRHDGDRHATDGRLGVARQRPACVIGRTGSRLFRAAVVRHSRTHPQAGAVTAVPDIAPEGDGRSLVRLRNISRPARRVHDWQCGGRHVALRFRPAQAAAASAQRLLNDQTASTRHQLHPSGALLRRR